MIDYSKIRINLKNKKGINPEVQREMTHDFKGKVFICKMCISQSISDFNEKGGVKEFTK
jgi:hypothetical protein